ncbi:MAG TPA: response regulator [Polyangiaceae bacterium]|nr:response regulator [Polyangiaceae bacterium]
MPKWRVLVVDDEVGMLEVCADTLSQLPNVEIVVEQESPRGARRLETDDFDLLITDVRMPDVDGVELLRVARRYQANIPVLVLTAFPTVDSAVETLKLGAADYVVKPCAPRSTFWADMSVAHTYSIKSSGKADRCSEFSRSFNAWRQRTRTC